MTVHVENGSKVLVELPNFVGEAGLQEKGDGVMLAYRPNKRGPTPKPGSSVTVAGRQRQIIAVSDSPYVTGMTVIQLN